MQLDEWGFTNTWWKVPTKAPKDDLLKAIQNLSASGMNKILDNSETPRVSKKN